MNYLLVLRLVLREAKDLCDHTPKRPGANIWPTRCWQIYPPTYSRYHRKKNFDQMLADLPSSQMLFSEMIVYGISHCTCRSPYITPADLPPTPSQMLISHMTVYGISQCTCRSTPHQMAISQDACSDSSYFIPTLRLIFGRPGVGRSTPCLFKASWEKTFDQVLAHLPLCQTVIIDSYSESSYLANQVLTNVPPCHVKQ